jgi:hypothetical protein
MAPSVAWADAAVVAVSVDVTLCVLSVLCVLSAACSMRPWVAVAVAPSVAAAAAAVAGGVEVRKVLTGAARGVGVGWLLAARTRCLWVCGVVCVVVSCTEGGSCVLSRRRGDRMVLMPLKDVLAVAVDARIPVGT